MTETHIELPGSRRPAKKGVCRLRDVRSAGARRSHHHTARAAAANRRGVSSQSPMTPKEFASEYGANLADVQKVEQKSWYSG